MLGDRSGLLGKARISSRLVASGIHLETAGDRGKTDDVGVTASDRKTQMTILIIKETVRR